MTKAKTTTEPLKANLLDEIDELDLDQQIYENLKRKDRQSRVLVA